MKDVLAGIVSTVAGVGAVGILLVAALDSSFLFLPLSVDLLVLSVSVDSGFKAVYYAAMAAAGSTVGTALVYALARKGGEEGLKRFGREKRIRGAQQKVQRNAYWAVAVAAAMPPPFPYTLVIAVAAASSYSKKKLLALNGVVRFSRYLIEALLGAYYGKRIASFMENSDVFYYFIMALAVVSVAGTIASVFAWVRRGR